MISKKIINRLLLYPGLIMIIICLISYFLKSEIIAVLAIGGYGFYILWFLLYKIKVTENYRLMYRK